MIRNASINSGISSLRWLLVGPLLVAWVGAAAPAEEVYLGEARDEKGRLVYTEKHRVTSTDGVISISITEYMEPDGELIAYLRSDYTRSVATPTYVFEDLRRDYREGLRWQDGAYVVFHQQGREPEKTATLGSSSQVFSCQGWHYYLLANLNLLERDNLTLNLVLPSELRAFPFVAKKLAADESRILAELSLKHWVFRYFTPKLRLEYDKQKGRLIEFHGISNILNSAGGRQEVTIRYRYQGDITK